MSLTDFQKAILEGIPQELPEPQAFNTNINHAPKRKDILTADEKKLAIKNALRYFNPKHHKVLAPEFKKELEKYGRIYMYRLRPDYKIYARKHCQNYRIHHNSHKVCPLLHGKYSYNYRLRDVL